MMVQAQGIPPHNHLSRLSSHLNLDGFPGYINTDFRAT